MKIQSYGATLTGSSGVNGDLFHISPDKKVYVLSDGASGAGKDGKVLMSNTCVEMAKQHDFSTSSLEPGEYVDSLFWKMNCRLIELSQKSRTRFFGTVAIAVVDEDTLTVTTLGDSPAFLFCDGIIKRVAKSPRRYEDMIEQGHITREEYEGYTKQMHERMRSCFDNFLPDVVPNNVIEQHVIKPGDMFYMCSDGLSDWIAPDSVFATIAKNGVKNGIDMLIVQAKELSLVRQNYYDDITAVAVYCRE